MGATTDVTQLDGLFKEIYAPKLMNLIPDVAILTKLIKFTPKTRIGDSYNQPVRLTGSQGVTYAAADAGAFTLNSSIAMTTKNAVVKGTQMLIRDQIAYDAAAKSRNGNKGAFVEVTRFVVECMLETMTKRLELSMLYGQSGIGIAASSANSSSTVTVVTMTTADWAVGVWSGLENAVVEFYTSNTTLISSGADANFTVTSVDVDNRTVTFTGTSTGITALDSAIGSNANDVNIHFDTAFGNEMAGVDKIITNTGTLFGISAATYNLWKGNVHTVTGTLTLGKIYGGVAKAVGRGLAEGVICLVNPNTWKDLSTDLAAARILDSSYKTSKNEAGQETICFYGQNGKIEVISHNCVREGDAFIVPVTRIKRVGASEITFSPFAGGSDKFFREMPDTAAYELRAYTDQAIFIECPAKCVKITGFTNA